VAIRGSAVTALAGHSRRGLGREANQDRWAAVPRSCGALLVVADGMGGTTGGASAAVAAVAAVLAAELDGATAGPAGEYGAHAAHGPLGDAVDAAERAVRAAASTSEGWCRPGCTLTAALVGAYCAEIAHLGDSSCWLVHRDTLIRLTDVHTKAAELTECGALEPSGLAAARLDNLLTRYLGMPGGAPVQRCRVGLSPGDRLLLATDGLTRSLPAATLAILLGLGAGPADLVDAAVAAGAQDDITAVLATLGTA